LDAVGLSPGLDSSCESGLSDDGRFIFSRTEDISTEYRTRFYIKDREMEYETKNIHVDTCETEFIIGINTFNSGTRIFGYSTFIYK
jgi:hypothetical protein